VLFGLAVEAVVSGPPTAVEAVARLALSIAGGIAVGLLVAVLVSTLRRQLRDVGLQLGLSLLTPYLAYVPGGRGRGVRRARRRHHRGRARARAPRGCSARPCGLQSAALWSLVDLLLNAVLFLLLGPAGPAHPRRGARRRARPRRGAAAAVVVTVLGLRLAWQFVGAAARLPRPVLAGRPEQRTGPG
jgi:CPA1 family monovalent cation:H+ antiporter